MDNQTMALTDFDRMILVLKHSKTNDDIDFIEREIDDFRDAYSGLIPNERLESLLDMLGTWVYCWRVSEKVKRQMEADELINKALNKSQRKDV